MLRRISVPVRLFAISYLLFFIGVLVTAPTAATFEDEESLEGNLSSADSFGEEDEEDAENEVDQDKDSEDDKEEDDPGEDEDK